MQAPRIALIHATPVAIDPIVAAFKRLWPEARTTSLLEDSLAPDLAAEGKLTEAMIERFVTLARYVRGCGAGAILFTSAAELIPKRRGRKVLTSPASAVLHLKETLRG